MDLLLLRPLGWPSASHPTPFAPTVQDDHLPDEQHPARAFPLVPLPAGAGGLRSHLRAAGLDGRSGACCVHCAGHGCPRALRGLRGEWAPSKWPWESCTGVGGRWGLGTVSMLSSWGSVRESECSVMACFLCIVLFSMNFKKTNQPKKKSVYCRPFRTCSSFSGLNYSDVADWFQL